MNIINRILLYYRNFNFGIMNRVDIRLEAIKIALQIHAMDMSNVIETAKTVENYIVGNADIPEYEDPNKILKDMVTSMGKLTDMNSIEESLSKKYGFGLCLERDKRENDN